MPQVKKEYPLHLSEVERKLTSSSEFTWDGTSYGRVTIRTVSPGDNYDATVEVPMGYLVAFVADYVREQKIQDLRSADPMGVFRVR